MSWNLMQISAQCALRTLRHATQVPAIRDVSMPEAWHWHSRAQVGIAPALLSARPAGSVPELVRTHDHTEDVYMTAEDSPESIYHIPVMPDEVTAWLAPAPGKLILDLTFGGGGHTRRLLALGADVMATDRDADAMAVAWEMEGDDRWADHLAAFRTDYDQYPGILDETGAGKADGILIDAGVSSWQLDSPNRGFSFRYNGPLDMRMNRDAPLTAEELVNTWPEDELVRILKEYGEERAARRIAAAIVRERSRHTIRTTKELADLVAGVVPKHGPTHVATRTFQAIRMAVNDELGCLERALEHSWRYLKPGGRLVTLTFHSLEDRIVKTFMRRHSEATIDNPTWPAPRPNPDLQFRLPTRKAITAGAAELALNPRARSAKLRIAEKI